MYNNNGLKLGERRILLVVETKKCFTQRLCCAHTKTLHGLLYTSIVSMSTVSRTKDIVSPLCDLLSAEMDKVRKIRIFAKYIVLYLEVMNRKDVKRTYIRVLNNPLITYFIRIYLTFAGGVGNYPLILASKRAKKGSNHLPFMKERP